MKTSVIKKLLLTAGVVALLGSEASFANSDPNTNAATDVPVVVNPPGFDLYDFSAAKSAIGLDGKIRILWDVYTGTPTLDHSLVWILDGTGSFLASSPNIPFNSTLPWLTPVFKTNTLIQGQADGNTTLVFVFSSNKTADGVVPAPPDSFSVININSSGGIVTGVGPIGPFAGTWIENIRFVGKSIVVHWISRNGATGATTGQTGAASTHTAWTLNEFGGLTGAAGPFAFLNTNARVDLNSNNQQVWLWDSGVDTSTGLEPSSNTNTLAVWVINPNGALVPGAAHGYGPF